MSTNAQISNRIEVLERELTISGNQMGKEAGLGNGTVDGWTDKQIEKISPTVEKFLNYWEINSEWWKTGQGEVFLTSGEKTNHNVEKPQEVSYEKTIEGLIKDLRENNQFLKEQFREIRETNERLRADLRAANDNAIRLATIALTESKQK